MRVNFLKLVISIAVLGAAMSFQAEAQKSNLVLHFWNSVGKKTLALDTATYTNKSGQPYTITNFKYYISNIRITDVNGHVLENKDGYYLIREDDEASWDADLKDIPAGNYKSISFMIGVDSLHNCSGAQSGALDPINGMFWTWNSGYIFMKLEGKSPASKSPGNIFEYHIGGYKAPARCMRNVTLNLRSESGLEPDMVEMDKTGKPNSKKVITEIFIRADAGKIMDSKTSIDISKLSSVTDFHHAPEIADNYQAMFSLINLKYDFK